MSAPSHLWYCALRFRSPPWKNSLAPSAAACGSLRSSSCCSLEPLRSWSRSAFPSALSASMNQTAARLDQTIRTLIEERNLSSAILGSMVEGVAVVNGAERLVFANHSFAEILELHALPKSGSALVEVVRQTVVIQAVSKVLAGEQRVDPDIVTGTLRQHFFAATVAAVRAGETSGAVLVLH